ncbi:hypothetical protein R0135_13560 [Congregibacter variabilis]|uniref:Uncharacterized protein n=1 Tax=Congregibacter variabilis TaxID=3081200 RepID=A0ABZ0I1W1_9GAMM|nr:hypothetical protein R0135_13560 [Congregibacter sp. IMCC43200]
MSHYWAKFKTMGGQRFRLDTRIYLDAIAAPDDQDAVIGCIIGKNPGSAVASKRSSQLAPIALSGDKFLPTVLSVLRQSYRRAQRPIVPGSYVQVLNLFYLCDRDLTAAKRSLKSCPKAPLCPTEAQDFPWAWFAWGGSDRVLDPLKPRFDALSSARSFYYCKDQGRVIARRPTSQDLAKHTQGMPQSTVVTHLAKLTGR